MSFYYYLLLERGLLRLGGNVKNIKYLDTFKKFPNSKTSFTTPPIKLASEFFQLG